MPNLFYFMIALTIIGEIYIFKDEVFHFGIFLAVAVLINCLFLLIFTAILAINDFNRNEHQIIRSTPIISLKDGQAELKGSFILGTGGVGTETYYYVYEVVGDNVYKLRKINTNSSTIKEFDGNPQLNTIYTVSSPTFFNRITEICNVDYERKSSYEINVPKGTIIRNFKVE